MNRKYASRIRPFALAIIAALSIAVLSGVADAAAPGARRLGETKNVKLSTPAVEVRWRIYTPCECPHRAETRVDVEVAGIPSGFQLWYEKGELTYPVYKKVLVPAGPALCAPGKLICGALTKPHRLRVPRQPVPGGA